VVKAVLPCVTGQTKKSIKSRLAAKKSPFGGMSFVAMFPQLVAGIAQENWYFIDSVPVVLFDPSHLQKRAYMTKAVKEDLKETRAAPKAKDADGQKRGMKVNVNMAWGPESLVGGTAIICDHAIPEIKKFAINTYTDVIFAPYCPADEMDEAAKAAAESLDARINFTLYAECVLPKVRGRIVRLMDWARSNGLDAELYRACRLFQDGEGGPLHNIIHHFAAQFKEAQTLFVKLPNGLTAEVQIGDRSGAHPAIHKAYESDAFKSMTDATVDEIVRCTPGLKAALDYLKVSGISTPGQITYKRALAYLPEVLQRCVTLAVVADSMRNSGYAPFDPSIMMNNMWNQFKLLSKVEADEVINISQTSIRAITEQRGIVYPKECMDALQAPVILNETIEFPEIREKFEDLAWGRQLTVDLSHSYISQEVRHRAERAAQAAIARREAALSKAEILKRDTLRFNHCSESRKVLENQNTEHRCRCGGKWSNGLPGFKAHEKNNKTHVLKFPDEYWHYDSEPAVVIPGGAGGADQSSEGIDVNNGTEAADPAMSYVNVHGIAGYMTSDEMAELQGQLQGQDEHVELLAANNVHPQVAQAASDVSARD
jgi:hypothetical protein